MVLVVIAAFLYWWHSRYYESTDDAQIEGNLVQISARIKGNITLVNVEENQQVQKGQLLVEIDPRDCAGGARSGRSKSSHGAGEL